MELQNLYCVGDKSTQDLHLLPTLVDGRPNPEAGRLDDEALRARGGPVRGRPRRRFFTPRRVEVIERLQDEGDAARPSPSSSAARPATRRATPASTPGCGSPPPRSGRGSGPSSTSAPPPWPTPTSTCSASTASSPASRWGVAAHHAGMVPPFKEAVEACFIEGLTKAVFATETLALGVNMPARSVVIERLTKFTGRAARDAHPGGVHPAHRPGRPSGIDDVGYAIVLWSPFVPFEQVAALASSRTYALRSAFRPTYNMAANLVRRYEPEQAHHLLNLSFAQYQADRAVVRLEARIERQQAPPRRGCEAEAALRAGRRRGVPPPAGRRPRRRAARAERCGAPSESTDRRCTELTPGDVRGARRHPPGRAERGVPQGPPAAARRRRAQQAAHHRRPTSFDEPPARRRHGGAARAVQPQQPGLPAPGRRRPAARSARIPRRRDGPDRPAPTPAEDGRPGRRAATPWPTAPTATPTCAAPSRPSGSSRELDDLAPAGSRAHGVAGPAVRPGAAPARGVGLPRRLGAHRPRARCWPAPTTSPTCWWPRP